MSNYLVIRTEYFFDGHGSGDAGNVDKFITKHPIYSTLDPNSYYDGYEIENFENEGFPVNSGDMHEAVLNARKNDDDLHEQDGYNCIAYSYTVREVGDDEAKAIQKIIDQYEAL